MEGALDQGCERCRGDAPADTKWKVLETLAVQSDGPAFLKRCTACGTLWHETLHDMRALSRKEAEGLYPEAQAAPEEPK